MCCGSDELDTTSYWSGNFLLWIQWSLLEGKEAEVVRLAGHRTCSCEGGEREGEGCSERRGRQGAKEGGALVVIERDTKGVSRERREKG